MQTQIAKLISTAISRLQSAGDISSEVQADIQVTRSKDKAHGDFACNVALQLAKQAKMPPRQFAEMLLAKLPKDSMVAKIEIAGPGFLNFYIQENLHGEILNTILKQQNSYGHLRDHLRYSSDIERTGYNLARMYGVREPRAAAVRQIA